MPPIFIFLYSVAAWELFLPPGTWIYIACSNTGWHTGIYTTVSSGMPRWVALATHGRAQRVAFAVMQFLALSVNHTYARAEQAPVMPS